MQATRACAPLAALTLTICLLAPSDQALAQRRVPLYRTGSPLSPYFTLFRNDVGGLTAYYTFLRPQEQLQSLQRAETARIDSLERQLQQRGAPPVAGRPSTAARYLDYSHFYGVPPVVGRQR
jgi:hypothetical protein